MSERISVEVPAVQVDVLVTRVAVSAGEHEAVVLLCEDGETDARNVASTVRRYRVVTGEGRPLSDQLRPESWPYDEAIRRATAWVHREAQYAAVAAAAQRALAEKRTSEDRARTAAYASTALA